MLWRPSSLLAGLHWLYILLSWLIVAIRGQLLGRFTPLGLKLLTGRPPMLLRARPWPRAAGPTPPGATVLGLVSPSEAARAELCEAVVRC